VPLEYLKDLAEYWQTGYDWRVAERRLNEYPQFVADVDGTTVHFLHIRSGVPDARPLLLTHGWPGSIVEFLELLGPLTDPTAFGGDASDAFDLVVPSLPGYGFSGPVADEGWDVRRIASALGELMERLGYSAYLVAGGDWGSIISLELARQRPGQVVGAHVSTVLTAPSGDPDEVRGLSATDTARLADMAYFQQEMSGYLTLQSTRPQTLGYGLNDSPVGQLAWIAEKFCEWNKLARTADDRVSRDALLTNATIYWLTGTAGSSAQLYFESAAYMVALFTPGVRPEPVNVPIGVAAFAQDSTPPIRAFAERDYPTITRWSEFDDAGHFATMEQPEKFVADLRGFTRSLTGSGRLRGG
jgi:microsomal epoxide hydrolase